MKKLCILLLGLAPIFGNAQDGGTWSISSHLQTDHSFIEPNLNHMMGLNYIEPMWQKKIQFTSGFGVNYRFKNNLEVSTGLRYSRKNQIMLNYYYPFFCGTAHQNYLPVAPVSQHYLEVPLLARFYFLPGKIKIHVESGWIGSYQVERTTNWEETSWLIGAQSGVGVNYFLKRWQFGLSANYRLQFQLGERDTYFGMNPHAFGFEFKTAFSLNN